jgi:hypothetical protein
MVEEYLEGALGRVVEDRPAVPASSKTDSDPSNYYKIPRRGSCGTAQMKNLSPRMEAASEPSGSGRHNCR